MHEVNGTWWQSISYNCDERESDDHINKKLTVIMPL